MNQEDKDKLRFATYTEVMYASSAPYDNPYQGTDKKVLFVCSAGILRSATGARIYARKYNTRSAGSKDFALIKVSVDLLLWADQVVFVNPANYLDVCQKFDLKDFIKTTEYLKVLNIEDHYEHMHPELIKEFEVQYEPIE